MRPERNLPFVLAVILFIGMGSVQFTGEASGVVVPDYDIFTSRTIVMIDEETGISTFQITLESHCTHTITVEVTNSCAGIQVSPMTSTITLGPGASSTINVAVAVMHGTPHRIQSLIIHAQVVRVDGVAITEGKERNAQVVVVIPRHQSISAPGENLTMDRGEVSLQYITVENTGNACDYVYLEFDGHDTISAWSASEFLQIPYAESGEYPVIIAVPKDAEDGKYSLDYTMTSKVNENVSVNGTCVVAVGVDENQENKSSPSSGFLMLGGGFLVFFLAKYFQIK